jgi:thymidylate synthase
MDIMWGSAINVFEWTILQESIAYWLSLPLGQYIHSVGSLHIYEDFIPRAVRISEGAVASDLPIVPFDVPVDAFDDALAEFVRIESRFRAGDLDGDLSRTSSKWLTHLLALNRAHWMATLTKNFEGARRLLHEMPPMADRAMALEQVDRMEQTHG